MELKASDDSYFLYKTRFNQATIAKRYNTRHLTSKKSRLEMECIKSALHDVPRNTLILDLPCGTGRLSFYLQDLGFNIIGADYSTYMLNYAEEKKVANENETHSIAFERQDVMSITHPDNTFAATICNRLFHHYPAAETRRRALQELARVTKGPIIVSFFNSYSLSAGLKALKNLLMRKKQTDRKSIPFTVFKADIKAAGLKIQNVYYTRFGLSPQTYVKLIKG